MTKSCGAWNRIGSQRPSLVENTFCPAATNVWMNRLFYRPFPQHQPMYSAFSWTFAWTIRFSCCFDRGTFRSRYSNLLKFVVVTTDIGQITVHWTRCQNRRRRIRARRDVQYYNGLQGFVSGSRECWWRRNAEWCTNSWSHHVIRKKQRVCGDLSAIFAILQEGWMHQFHAWSAVQRQY